MKKIVCLCLVFLLCFGLFGCGKVTVTSEPDEYEYIDGEVIDVLESGALELKVVGTRDVDAWGETVTVITDDAEEWCVGDKVEVAFSQVKRPLIRSKNVKIYAYKVYTPSLSAKPIIYLYPEEPTLCSVKVTLNGELTCTYPAHGEHGWQDFTAYPDGTLVFPDGKEYYALYWEGVQYADWDFSVGYCVKGEDTAEFLEWALTEQGLSRRELNEFIIYWLPIMQNNPYNVISFQKEAYTDGAILDISPAPDSLLRVFMTFYASETEVDIAPQNFEPFTRNGFTVVEWGGSQIVK